jgi:hypothetical protein
MSTLYFSGMDRPSFLQILHKEQAAGMVMRFVLTERMIETLRDCHLRMVMDSGAFVKDLTQEDIESYARMVILHADLFEWFANCDKIGDQEQSNANYAYLLSLLPEALHHKVLWIYQYGSPLEYLDEALATRKRIGIGGLVPVLKQDAARAHRLIADLARHVASAGVSAHYFGASSLDVIKRLHEHHEDFSVDSTTWLVGARNRELINREGKRFPSTLAGCDFSTEECLAQNVRTMRRWVEGEPIKPKKHTAMLQMSLDLFATTSGAGSSDEQEIA